MCLTHGECRKENGQCCYVQLEIGNAVWVSVEWFHPALKVIHGGKNLSKGKTINWVKPFFALSFDLEGSSLYMDSCHDRNLELKLCAM